LRDFRDGFCGADGSDVRKRKSNLHGTPSGHDAGYLTTTPLATQTGDREPGLLEHGSNVVGEKSSLHFVEVIAA
jgi:hypothetical protein